MREHIAQMENQLNEQKRQVQLLESINAKQTAGSKSSANEKYAQQIAAKKAAALEMKAKKLAIQGLLSKQQQQTTPKKFKAFF